MADRTAKMAVVGLGNWGRNHAFGYDNYHRSEVALVCDADEDRAKEIGGKYSCKWTTKVEDVASSDVDGVTVATPDFLHLEVGKTLIEAGKDCMIEKPLATKVSEAKELVEAAERKGVRLMVPFLSRFNPKFNMAKDRIESGDFGETIFGYIRLSDWMWVATDWLPWAGDSGPEWFLFPHTMDIIRWLIEQEPVEVYAKGTKKVLKEKGVDAYDVIQALVTFDKGTFVTFETSWILPNGYPNITDFQMTLYGSKEKIFLHEDFPGVAISTSERHDYPWLPLEQVDRWGRCSSFMYESMRQFVDCILDDKEVPISGSDGLVATAMIEATLKSVESGQPIPITY
jgi:predicted dehydrogenase